MSSPTPKSAASIPAFLEGGVSRLRASPAMVTDSCCSSTPTQLGGPDALRAILETDRTRHRPEPDEWMNFLFIVKPRPIVGYAASGVPCAGTSPGVSRDHSGTTPVGDAIACRHTIPLKKLASVPGRRGSGRSQRTGRPLLRKHAPIARQTVRKLVEGRIVFTPDLEARRYRFTMVPDP